MYAAGHGIRPWRANRAGGFSWATAVRLTVVMAVVAMTGFGMAVAAHGGGGSSSTTVVVQPGDTLWTIAAQRYPNDDVRDRVQDIEQANGLTGPEIRVGEVLRLP